MEDGLGGTMMEFFTIDIAIFFSTTDLTSNRKYSKNSKRFFRVDFERREEGGERRRGSIFNSFPLFRPRRGVGVSSHVEGEQHAQPRGKVARPAEDQRRGQLQMLHLRANFQQFVEFGAERGCLLHGIDQR